MSQTPTDGDGSRGMILLALSYGVFPFVTLGIKLIGPSVSMPFVMVVRSAVHMVLSIGGLSMWAGGRSMMNLQRLPIGHKRCLAWRGIFYWLHMFLFWSAIRFMPLGDATAINNTWQIIASLIGHVFLQEEIDWNVFFTCSALSICGVVFIVQPKSMGFHPHIMNEREIETHDSPDYWLGFVCAIFGALSLAMLPITTRLMRDQHWLLVELTSTIPSMFLLSPAALLLDSNGLLWKGETESAATAAAAAAAANATLLIGGDNNPLSGSFNAVVGVSILELGGMALWTIGYQNATAVQGAMGSYVMIVISYLLQDVFFGDALNLLGAAGVLLICSSCFLHTAWTLAMAKAAAEAVGFSAQEQQRLFGADKNSDDTLWLNGDL